MSRAQLLEHLVAHRPWNEREAQFKDQLIEFVRTEPDCFHRSLLKGHVTGSALITDPQRSQFLFLFHTKLERWLQPGGHADGNPDVLSVALREAEEETGLTGFRVVAPSPLDLDIHPIPARGAEPQHFHYDIRYLLEADPAWKLTSNSESRDLRWIPRSELRSYTTEESVLRMVEKVRPM